MATYLFAWNPSLWKWPELRADVRKLARRGHLDTEWSAGRTRRMEAGSRAFLVRVGVAPKGLFGAGYVLTEPEERAHWWPEKAARGATTQYVTLRLSQLFELPPVTYADLAAPPFARFRWGVRASGVRVPSTLADALEDLWESHAAQPLALRAGAAHASDAARIGVVMEALTYRRSAHRRVRALSTRMRWRAPRRGRRRSRPAAAAAQPGDIIDALVRDVIPNGSPLVRPGFTGFITTGGTTASTLATTAASVASPQRYGLTAFNLLEDVSLRWLSQMLGIARLAGVYSSGGSTANLLAIGAARQWAFERAGRDPAAQGVDRPVAVYASTEAHHTIQRSAGVLGIGRRSVRAIGCDSQGRLSVSELRVALDSDLRAGVLPVAIVANAGTTNTGAIDPIAEIAQVAKDAGAWLHVDGAYGLPGILDERKAPLYRGLEHADSVIVDPHKWLGASGR